MKKQRLIIISLCGLCFGCVHPPQLEDEYSASLKSNYPIVSIDGENNSEHHSVQLPQGIHTVEALYKTHRYVLRCKFKWQVKPGQHYEIVSHNTADPLILYRWQRRNALWAERKEPLEPLHCTRE